MKLSRSPLAAPWYIGATSRTVMETSEPFSSRITFHMLVVAMPSSHGISANSISLSSSPLSGTSTSGISAVSTSGGSAPGVHSSALPPPSPSGSSARPLPSPQADSRSALLRPRAVSAAKRLFMCVPSFENTGCTRSSPRAFGTRLRSTASDRRRHPVEEDRQDDHGDTGLEAQSTIVAGNTLINLVAQATRANHARDDDHGQAQHDDLVDTGHDRGDRQRQLNTREHLAGRGTECLPRLHQFLVDLADAQLGQAYPGRHREHDGGDDTGYRTDGEEEDRRDQVDERRQGLHQVQDRLDDLADHAVVGSKHTDRDRHEHRDEAGHQDQAQGVHRVGPLI